MRPTFRPGRPADERGQALVLFVIMLILLLGTAALVIDGGVFRRSAQEQRNALDAGALAGAGNLPGNPTKAASDALKFALANHPGLTAGSVNVSFRCLVGDRNGDGRPDAADLPATCNPGPSPSFTCANGICVAPCNPAAGHVCNTVVVSGTVSTDYRFDQVTGVPGPTTTLDAAACVGLCGADPSAPLDIGFIIDRTGSMSDADLANVKNATLSTLTFLDPTMQSVALAALGQSRANGGCGGPGQIVGKAWSSGGTATWVTVPYPTSGSLSTDYQNAGGSLNANSAVVRSVNCLDHSSTGTNMGDPLLQLATVMQARGRAGVLKGIIMMTDGAANEPNTRSCKYALDKAAQVKAMGIELYTIGFGVAGDMCTDVDGTYRNAPTAQLLAAMASQPTVYDGCNDAENADGDHFFCEPRSDSLASVFRAAATALVSHSARLVHLP